MPLSECQEKELIARVNEAGVIHNLNIHSLGDNDPVLFGQKNTPERKALYNRLHYWRKLPAEKLAERLEKFIFTKHSPDVLQNPKEEPSDMSMHPAEDDLFGNTESPSLAASSLSSHTSQGTVYWDVINVDTSRPFHHGSMAVFFGF